MGVGVGVGSGSGEWEWGMEVEWKWKSGHRIDAVTRMVCSVYICLSDEILCCLHTQEASGVGCRGAAPPPLLRKARVEEWMGDRLLIP